MQLCTPDTEHLTSTEYTGEVHSAWPLPQPQKRSRKATAALGVIDLLDASRGPGRTRPAPTTTGPRKRRLRKPTPASTSSTSPRSPTTPPKPPDYKPCLGHTSKAQTSWDSWSNPSAERTSPNRHRSWTWRGMNIRPTGLYHKTTVTVHAHPDLGVDGRLGAYECVGPGRQANVLLTHVPFGEETKDFLGPLSLACCRFSLLAPTIIIGDLNAAPTDDDRTGPPTATNIAVHDAMHQLGLTDLTAGLARTPSHYPHQAGAHPSRIDTCYGDLTTLRVHEATYGDLLPAGKGH